MRKPGIETGCPRPGIGFVPGVAEDRQVTNVLGLKVPLGGISAPDLFIGDLLPTGDLPTMAPRGLIVDVWERGIDRTAAEIDEEWVLHEAEQEVISPARVPGAVTRSVKRRTTRAMITESLAAPKAPREPSAQDAQIELHDEIEVDDARDRDLLRNGAADVDPDFPRDIEDAKADEDEVILP